MKMKFKELCDFTTIDKNIIDYENSKYTVKIGNDVNCKEALTNLLNTIASAIRNRSKWAKFKRVNSMILGFIFGNDKSKIGSYNRGLKKALTDIREIIKDVISASKHFQLVDSLYEKEGEMGYIKNYEFPCKIQKGEGGVCTYFIDENGIKNFFKKYRAYRKVVKNKIKQFNKDLEKRSIEDIKLAEVKRAIAILENCLEIRLDPNISDSSTAEEIIKADLPRSRAYRLSDKLNLKNEKEETIIKEHIPFYIEEIEALEKGYEVGIEYDDFLHLPEQNISDKEVIKLQKKLKAFEAANCICSGNITDDNIKEIKAFEDSEEEPKASNSIVNMANEAISKKTRKIYGVWFCCAVVCILICAIISFHAPLIRYVNGKEVTTIVDGCEYTYRKFDDAGVEIIAAKMPEGISEYAVIPEIDGHKVVAISEGVFEDYTDFESVYIGKDIVEIGNNAFAKKDNRITIYCEAQAKPDAWAKDWANDNVVVWGWTDSQQNIEITWGNLRFAIDKGKKQAAILGLSSEDKGDEVDEIEIPSNVTYEGEEYAVIRVADKAFKGCSSLDTVNFDATSRLTELGAGVFADCQALQNITIPNAVTSIKNDSFNNCNNLTSIVIPKAVIEIGDNAFKNCSKLSSLIISANVTFVGDAAFEGCNAITDITMPTIAIEYISKYNLQEVIINGGASIGRSAFYNCKGLTSVTIGNSVTSIGNYAFSDCTSLTSVTIGESVASIGRYAFSDCANLRSIVIPYSVASIEEDAFYGCSNITKATIPTIAIDLISKYNLQEVIINGGGSIESYIFEDCTSLTSVTIGESVASIGRYAFKNCANLRSIVIPDSVASIEEDAFYGCSNITKATIPTIAIDLISKDNLQKVTINGGASIGSSAFENCTNLTSISIPNSVTSIGSSAFRGCKGLTSIVIPDSVTSIGRSAFYNCKGLTSIVIPDSVTSIGDWAFSDCTGLTSIVIPDSVTSIGDLAFSDCTGLTSIVIPDSVTFSDCKGLTSIVIPDSVKRIGHKAFYNCTSLIDVTFENTQSWQVAWDDDFLDYRKISSSDLADATLAATYLKDTYRNYYWRRVE